MQSLGSRVSSDSNAEELEIAVRAAKTPTLVAQSASRRVQGLCAVEALILPALVLERQDRAVVWIWAVVCWLAC